MKISYNWLKDFINLELNPEETADKLTLIGLEVDEAIEYGNLLDGVVVGKVLEVNDHPNADRLSLCHIDTGSKKLQIVCGAKNVAAGQKVPVAILGATLPVELENGKPFTIRQTKLRGEVSEGMICSESELNLGTDHEGIMVLDDDLEAGTPLRKVLDLTLDTIFDIEITPNRPDTTCHLGVARDLSAALDLELCKPFKTDLPAADSEDDIEIRIKNSDKCRRYVGKIIRNVKIGDSPPWLKNRLEALGLRPVNNVVDATNYVMFELGQPLHAFDLENIAGHSIIVQDFDEPIEFETLDHVQRNCPPGTLFICDGNGPIAMAGVMGGVNSEVSDATTDIMLESAYFDPATIRKTAKQQNLQTDASYRFERGIDPAIQRIAAERAAKMIAELTGGMLTDKCTDVHPVKTQPVEITLRKSYVNRLLGTDFTLNEITELIDGLELRIIKKDAKYVIYSIPSFRPDLQREVDLVEEVGRLYDYNKIDSPQQTSFIEPKALTDWEQLNTQIKEIAKGLRFKEIFSNSLMSDKDAAMFEDVDSMIHTLNPISTDMTTLRPFLLPGFLQSAAYNFNRNASGVRFFETGHVFRKSKHGTYYPSISENVQLLIGIAGYKTVEHWHTELQKYDLFDLKSCVESFLRSLKIDRYINTRADKENALLYSIDDHVIGKVFTVQQSLLDKFNIEQPIFAAEFSITNLHDLKARLPAEKYTPVSKFPAFEFDFAVIVDAILPAQNLLETIKQTADKLDDIQIFDLFEGESLGKNKKSLAFRLSFLDKNKTLTINDVEPIIDKVLKVLDNKYSAKLRS